MSDAVLVLNAGSSSIKFGLFDISGTEPRFCSQACSTNTRPSQASP